MRGDTHVIDNSLHFACARKPLHISAGALLVSAQLLQHKDLSASMALTIAQTAIATCKANGYAVSSTVVGRNGEAIAQIRGDNTGPHTVENDSFRERPIPRAPSGSPRARWSSA